MRLENFNDCEDLKKPKCENIETTPHNNTLQDNEIFECSGNDNKIGDTCDIACQPGFMKVTNNINSTEVDFMYECQEDLINTKIFDPSSAVWNLIDADAKNNECCKPACPPNFIDPKADFFVVMDKSSSIGLANFEYVKQFFLRFLDTLPLGNDAVKIRFLTYNHANNIEVVIDLQESVDLPRSVLDDRIQNMQYKGKGTHTGDALLEVVENAMSHNNTDNRPDVEDILVLVTDGKASNGQQPKIDSAVTTLKNDGWTIMAIAVGDKIKPNELASIASDPAESFIGTAEDFSKLVGMSDWVMSSQCPVYTCP